MTAVRPAEDTSPASWLLRANVDWWDLVRFGPPGFAAYVRIAFGDEDTTGPGEEPTLRTALRVLAAAASTPDDGYAAVWEGWTGSSRLPTAPRIPMPHREMLLFIGPVEALRDAPELAWFGTAHGYAEPHLVWPADRTWCLACEVDEEIEFTVGCSSETAAALAAALPGMVRQVSYGDRLPLDHPDR